MSDGFIRPTTLRLLENRAWVRALARRLLADENDVDDVEQDTWAVALSSGPDEPRALRSWLGVVASRFALQRIRGRSRRARLEESTAGSERVERSPADVVAEADAHGHVVQAVLALDEPYRTTVLLRYFEGLAIADVARKMDVPMETVRTRLRRAHERLRGSLEGENKRAVALLLAPLGATATPRAAAESPTRIRFGRASALKAAGVGVLALAAWTFTRGVAKSDDAKSDVAAARVVSDAHGELRPVAKPPEGNVAGVRRRTATTSLQDAAPPQAQPAAAPASDAWTAYDLADGKPLPAFALRVTTSAGETSVTTDDAGRIAVDRATVLDVAPAEATVWTFARPTKGEVKEEPSLWFWRERGVVGIVKSAATRTPLAFASVKFTWSTPFGDEAPDEPGVGSRWMTTHGFDRRTQGAAHLRVDADGRITGTAPALRRAYLTAEPTGLAPDAARLSWANDGDCAVSFEIRPLIRVVGRVLDAAGNPVVGQSVSLDASIDVASSEEAARLQALRPHGGFGYAGRVGGGGVVTFVAGATTDVRGIFKIDAAPVGSIVASVWREGCLLCRKELGVLEKDVDPFEMRLLPSDVRVAFVDAGMPVASNGLTLQVADNRENGFSLTTDADGRADAGWLQRGRWYRVVAKGRNVCFRWDGQAVIDLAQLPKEPSKDK